MVYSDTSIITIFYSLITICNIICKNFNYLNGNLHNLFVFVLQPLYWHTPLYVSFDDVGFTIFEHDTISIPTLKPLVRNDDAQTLTVPTDG